MKRFTPREQRPIVLNEKIAGSYVDIEVWGPSSGGDIHFWIPVAGALRLNIHRFTYLFPRSMLRAVRLRSELALPRDPSCASSIELGQERFCCQLRDGHLGDHEHCWHGWRRLPYEIRWPGYYRARDLTDASPPQKQRYQRRTFDL